VNVSHLRAVFGLVEVCAELVQLLDGPRFKQGDRWKVADVAAALGITPRTVEHLKQRFVDEGIETALERRARTTPPRVTFGGAFDARLMALAWSPAPDGRARCTVRRLAEKLVELKIAPFVSPMTVQRSPKKTKAASSEQILEDPSGQQCGLRREHGGRARGLCLASRSAPAGRLHGRIQQTARRRSAGTDRCGPRASLPG